MKGVPFGNRRYTEGVIITIIIIKFSYGAFAKLNVSYNDLQTEDTKNPYLIKFTIMFTEINKLS